MEDKPLISIIIVNYNGVLHLEKCLASLKKVDYDNHEIILVDNNSSDDSIEFVKNNYPKIIIIKLDKNYGFAYPNNVGAKNARGPLLLFLNNDTITTPNFVSELVKIMNSDPKIGICQSLLLKINNEVDSSGDFIDSIGVAYSSKERVRTVKEILSAKGASMIIRKDIFERLGGFDEKFFVSFEDVDLGWRCWIIGYKVVVVPASIVYHIGGQTINKMKSELAFHGIKNQISMKITNFEVKLAVKNLLLFFGIHGFKMIRVFLDYEIRGKTEIKSIEYEDKIAQKPDLKAILKSIIWIYINIQYLRKKHNHVSSTRVCTTKDLQKMNLIRSKI